MCEGLSWLERFGVEVIDSVCSWLTVVPCGLKKSVTFLLQRFDLGAMAWYEDSLTASD